MSRSRLAIQPLLVGALLLALLAGCSAPAAKAQPPAAIPAEAELVVLVHGLGRSDWAMLPLAEPLEAAGYATVVLDYDSLGHTPDDVLRSVTAQIDACCADRRGTVHFVGHSLGGLLVRAYLAERRPPRLGRVVLMGTPNHGTPVVDRFRERWWMRLAGDTALALGTGQDSFPATLGPPDYPVGVIAGTTTRFDNDSVIPGPDDGLVPVESTKVEGMADFIVLPVTHAGMRRDEAVATQVIAFLRTGRFRHP